MFDDDFIQKYIDKSLGKQQNRIKYDTKVLDLRHLKTYSIDNINSNEIDDAISYQNINGKKLIWIHIASPATYIKYNSKFDKYARNILTSLYLVDKNISMFPEKLITDFLSLKQGRESICLSTSVELDNDGEIMNYQVTPTIIKLNLQLNYNELDELLDYEPIEENDIIELNKILSIRRKYRINKGAIIINQNEGRLVSSNGKLTINYNEDTLARRMVSEANILFGNIIAKFAYNKRICIPYRSQAFNKLKTSNNNNNSNFIVTNYLNRCSIGKSNISIEGSPHFALGLELYTQASSPLRRYIDLITHYQILNFIYTKKSIPKEEVDQIISKYRNNFVQISEIYKENNLFWLEKWFRQNKNTIFTIYFFKYINFKEGISVAYFLDFHLELIIKIHSNYEMETGEKASIKFDDNLNIVSFLEFKHII